MFVFFKKCFFMNKAWHEKLKSVKSSYIAQEHLETTEKCPTCDVFQFVPHVTWFFPYVTVKVLKMIFFSRMGLTWIKHGMSMVNEWKDLILLNSLSRHSLKTKKSKTSQFLISHKKLKGKLMGWKKLLKCWNFVGKLQI